MLMSKVKIRNIESSYLEECRNFRVFLTSLFRYNFKPEMIDTCYNFAKFQYECGNYSGASEYLYFHR